MVMIAVRPEILGRLLVVPSMLEVLPETGAIARFLEAALQEIPGVDKIYTCIDNELYPCDRPALCSQCAGASVVSLINHRRPPPCQLLQSQASDKLYRALSVSTSRCSYGYLVAQVSDIDQFSVYEPYVRNVTNIVATVIENRIAFQELKKSNERLGEVLEHLEQRVLDRTHVLCEEITRREKLEVALRTSERKYRTLLETSSEGFWLVDINLKTIEVNDALCNLLECDREDLIGKTPFHFIAEEHHQRFAQHMEQLAIHNHRQYELMLHKKNGDVVYTIVHGTTLRDESGQVQGAFGYLTDISDRKRNEAKLQLAAHVFTHAREGIFITDSSGKIIDINDSFTDITGYERHDVLGRDLRVLKSSKQDAQLYKTLWQNLLTHGYWCGEVWSRRQNGQDYIQLLTISSVFDDQNCPQYYVALFSDITEQKQHEQELEYTAHYDPLTNLPNRRLLFHRLHQSMKQVDAKGGHLAVVYLDLDGFKAVNDTYNHEAGDYLLKTLAHRMKQVLREGDTLARLGGDEFVAVLGNCASPSVAISICSRLLGVASQPVLMGDRLLQVSASLGITFYPQKNIVDAGELLRQSDQAMYQVKLSGKNQYHIFCDL